MRFCVLDLKTYFLILGVFYEWDGNVTLGTIVHGNKRIISTGAFHHRLTLTIPASFPASLPESVFFYFAVLPGLRVEVRVFLISLYIIGAVLSCF